LAASRSERSVDLAPPGRRASFGVLAAVALAAAAAPRAAAADEGVVYKRGAFVEEGTDLALSVGFRELFTSGLRARLQDGFATTVVMRLYLYEEDGEAPIAVSARTLKAVYDLWEEKYLLRIEEPQRTRAIWLRSQKDVVDRLTSLYRFPVAKVWAIQPGARYFVAVIAEVNPISEELLSDVRRWLRNPSGRSQVGSESFFGSFVSIFINNKIRRAERSFRLRTQTFFRKGQPGSAP
jgi:hypothetical protein